MHEVVTLGRDGVEEVVDLLEAASTFDELPFQQVLENVGDDAGVDDELVLGVRADGRLVGGAIGTAREEWGAVKAFGVAKDVRRQGVGSAMLAELERRLAARGAKKVRFFYDAPHYLRPGIDYRDTPFISFVERRGFRQVRACCNMSADLATAPLDTAADEARLRSDGFEVRRLEKGDSQAFDEYLLTVWHENWRVEGVRSLRRNPVSTHVALRDGKIVGFASHSVSGPGQFGPMGTNPELRGKGVGAVLLKRCLADQRDAGFAESDIQWVGPKGFYADQVGAVISRCFWQYEKELASS